MTDANGTIPQPTTDDAQGSRLLEVMPHYGRVAFYLFSILMAVWTIGRLLEGISGHAIFEPWLVRTIGASAGIMILTALLVWFIQSVASIVEDCRQPRIYPAWLLLVIIGLGATFLLRGYAIAVSGLFAMFTGAFQDAELATFALFKSHPGTPILALNLILLKLFHSGFDAALMAPLTWKFSFLLGFSIWSILLGTLLLFLRGIKGVKTIHLALAIAGTLLTMYLKSHPAALPIGAVFLHAATVTLIVFQLLLIYASLRAALPMDALSFKQLPRGLTLGLMVVLLIPVVTDLYQQNAEIVKSKRLVESLPMAAAQGAREVILMAPVSVHMGPAYGDPILGKLPAQTKVAVAEKKFGWVRIGPNRWIEDRYLSPVKTAVQSSKFRRTGANDRS